MLLTDFKSKGGPLQSLIVLFYVSNKQQNAYNLTLFQTDVKVTNIYILQVKIEQWEKNLFVYFVVWVSNISIVVCII